MLAPARIPVAAGKKMAKTEKKVSSRKSGPMFSHMMAPDGETGLLKHVDGHTSQDELQWSVKVFGGGQR